ncbi:hypothetical protein LLH06_04410 [Mucilaginibacter daejeonensis]|uniref:hypothetical protein n=1 Tax=Mucilaginibacter daejeonensis TaxID=398049 RepID=UPI001D175D3D|nr:hypothetical protein [Mucilaginibacter daejeonensis]UEG54211.1 hypothetical protein LLH06_04410 [Mucilaginibacter daejeonensis]
MKKTFLCMMVAIAASVSSYAQTTATISSSLPRPKLGIGFDVGVPLSVGGLDRLYTIGIGGAGKYDLPVSSSFSFSFTAGYMSYSRKKYNISFYNFQRTGADGYIPAKAGGKYYFIPNFYGEAEIGVLFGINHNTGNSFIYAPGLGTSFPVSAKHDIDIGARYEGWSQSGGNTGQVAFRIAYKFGL